MLWTLGTFKFEACRNSEPQMSQWSIQAVKYTGKCPNEACALWPTSKGQGISEISLHHTVGVSGAAWWGWAGVVKTPAPYMSPNSLAEVFPSPGPRSKSQRIPISSFLDAHYWLHLNGWFRVTFLRTWWKKKLGQLALEEYGNKHTEQTGKWNVLTALLSSVTMTYSSHLLGNV